MQIFTRPVAGPVPDMTGHITGCRREAVECPAGEKGQGVMIALACNHQRHDPVGRPPVSMLNLNGFSGIHSYLK